MKKSELFESVPLHILERTEVEESGQKRMRIRGIFHRADERNANNRIYPKQILEREVKRLADRINSNANGTVFMQADHPADGVSRIADTAAILHSVSFDPRTNEVIGEADIIPTQQGKDLAEIIRANGKVGISARGFGSTTPGELNGVKADIVQEDYLLSTFDFVVGQSTRNAVVTNFSEQARVLAGLAEGENEMDLTNLDVEKLKAARPDLVSTIEKTASDAATKKAKDESAQAVATMIAEETQKIEAKLRKEIEEAAKKKTAAADKEDEEDDGDDEDEEDANGKKKKKNEQKLKEAAEKAGFKLVAKDEPNVKVEQEVARLQKQLTEAMSGLQALTESQKRMDERTRKADVHEHVLKVTQGEKKYKNALIERLLKCATVEEVDAKLESERADIERLLNETAGGKGVAGKSEEFGSPSEKKMLKTKAGTMLTEAQVAQRRLAGIKTELAE